MGQVQLGQGRILCAAWVLGTLLLIASGAVPAGTLDGRFTDWSAVPAVQWENPRSMQPAVPAIARIAAYADGRTLWLDVTLSAPVVLQSSPRSLVIRIDADGDPHSGRQGFGVSGVDLAVEFSPANGGRHFGARVLAYGMAGHKETEQDLFNAGVASAPTIMARRFEIKLDRVLGVANSPSKWLAEGRIRLCAALVGVGGPIMETPALALSLPPRSGPVLHDALWLDQHKAGLRVLSWNVSRESLLHHPQAFLRIFRAAHADVLLLDEVSDRVNMDTLSRLLEGMGSGPWHVLRGAGGGDERGVIASRFPVESIAALHRIEYPESVRGKLPQPLERIGVPASGFMLHVDHTRLMLLVVDLMCCGSGVDDPREKLRELQAQTARTALRRAISKQQPDGVLVVGDFNLVVAPAPLTTLARGLDPDGGDLQAVMPRQPDRRLVSTWRKPGDLFGPGLLDYQLYSASRLAPVASVILAPEKFSEQRRKALGLRADDGLMASDHIPIVTDFRIHHKAAITLSNTARMENTLNNND